MKLPLDRRAEGEFTQQILQSEKGLVVQELTTLRLKIKKMEEVDRKTPMIPSEAEKVEKAYRELLVEKNNLEEKLTLLKVQDDAKYVIPKDTGNLWVDTLGATNGLEKRDMGQSQEGAGFRS